MSDELFPLQFIEGINEYGRYLDEYINMDRLGYLGIAIQYTPKYTYNLQEFSTFLTEQKTRPEFIISLYTHHIDTLNRIILRQGKSFVTEDNYNGWQLSKFDEPVVVIAKHTYWLVIELEKNSNICLAIAQQGTDMCNIRYKVGNKWETQKGFEKFSLMFRFYGRIIPIVGQTI
jgi:hypothetical protein